ncbi:MAG TPA: septal ring lytic transglycosylase RlpA family protein [Chloroflexota bacterium]|jgi:rare lipoprotein A
MRLSRPALIASLTAVTAAASIGCQQMLVTNATFTTNGTPLTERTLAFQHLDTQQATLKNAKTTESALYMPAATQTGLFEDAFKPLPAPTPAPVIVEVPAPAPATVATAPEPEPEQEAAAIDVKPLLYEVGIASTYGQGDGFEGMRTGCGQIFHTHVVQVAHKTLPCGTLIRIVDTDTGKSVDAEVTDRGPYVAGRIVDLSYAAFTELDPVGTGLLHVNVYILDTSNQYLYRLR